VLYSRIVPPCTGPRWPAEPQVIGHGPGLLVAYAAAAVVAVWAVPGRGPGHPCCPS
jgi:hypothetical protein